MVVFVSINIRGSDYSSAIYGGSFDSLTLDDLVRIHYVFTGVVPIYEARFLSKRLFEITADSGNETKLNLKFTSSRALNLSLIHI